MTESSTEGSSGEGGTDRKSEGIAARVAGWFDTRLGLSHQLLRPAPQYSINPFYWLGALATVAFVIQGVTGGIMMLYYVPSPTQAYPTTQYIFQNVSYGTFLETVHLYTAYAMIMLAFMHLMRGYFVSVHKKPRELMWVTGMVMGFVTLGFGFTGYLLPWTVVSKSATDVGVGMISALCPTPNSPLCSVSSFLTFLVVGSAGDTAELLRFYDLHVFVLPAILLVLLVVKMYMLETHGVAEPASGTSPLPQTKRRLVPIFPDVSFYLFELAAIFGSAVILVSIIFPLTLPPEYSAAVAGQYVAQPDWYFLWIYQLIKVSAFEEAGLPVALSAVTLIFVVLVLLPFIDRGKTRNLRRRTVYVTLGAIFVAEVAVLAIWGYLTPGVVIPNEQATLVLGGTAVSIALVSVTAYKLVFGSLRLALKGNARAIQATSPPSPKSLSPRSAAMWISGAFVALLVMGAFFIGSTIDVLAAMALGGLSWTGLSSFAISLGGLSLAVAGTMYLLYRLDLGSGSIKRRIRAFEIGWRG
jgi:quinol-cytochrome oxidoreductase complex cytochrome b subunit